MDCLDNCKSKVYINPNFNKPVINNLCSNATMHFNPKFTHLVSNVKGNTQIKNKIYVNPNFIKDKSLSDGAQHHLPIATKNDVFTNNQNSNDPSYSMDTCQQVAKEKEAQVPTSQSRYCLIKRDITVTNKLLKAPVIEKSKNTFNLNKYKSVPWNYIKTNLNNLTNITNNNSTFGPRFKTSLKSVGNGSKNKFRVINCNNATIVNQDKTKTKICLDEHNKIYKSNQESQSRMKKAKGNLKKNNIPCPLFRKYGKCLRINRREKCEFLHDKKHVSICRKFIKGLCHDKDCLLSHDLTSEKMPTCYFYLQGTCTKLDCPYLHVKLNEKTKICLDFLKGYCEKGSNCLQRHINVSNVKNNKQTSHTSSMKNKCNLKSRKISLNKSDHFQKEEMSGNVKIKSQDSSKLPIKTETSSEYRYYQEQSERDTNDTCEVIKPMRCKLGILPSFIQL